MEEGWKEVYTTGSEYKMQMAKDLLQNAKIEVVLLNQQDTAYKIFGNFCIYVAEENADQAVELLKNLKGE